MAFFRGGRDPCGPDDEGGAADDGWPEHLLLSVSATRDTSLLTTLNIGTAVTSSPDEVDGTVIRSSAVVPAIAHTILNEVAKLRCMSDGEDINPLLVGCGTFEASQRVIPGLSVPVPMVDPERHRNP